MAKSHATPGAVAAVPDTQEFLERVKREIHVVGPTADQAIVKIGKKLIEVKALVGIRRFEEFVMESTWSESQADRFMRVAEMLGESSSLAPLEQFVAVLNDDVGAAGAAAHYLCFRLQNDRARVQMCMSLFDGFKRGTVAPEVFAEVLRVTWQAGTRELSLRASGISYKTIAAMFDSVSPDHLMIPGSLADLRRLPDEITVWRGGADISVRKLGNGMSWTLKPATAIWFARHLVPYFAKNPLCIRDPGQGRMKQSPSHSSFDAVPSLVAFAAFKFQPPGPFAPPGDVALPGH